MHVKRFIMVQSGFTKYFLHTKPAYPNLNSCIHLTVVQISYTHVATFLVQKVILQEIGVLSNRTHGHTSCHCHRCRLDPPSVSRQYMTVNASHEEDFHSIALMGQEDSADIYTVFRSAPLLAVFLSSSKTLKECRYRYLSNSDLRSTALTYSSASPKQFRLFTNVFCAVWTIFWWDISPNMKKRNMNYVLQHCIWLCAYKTLQRKRNLDMLEVPDSISITMVSSFSGEILDSLRDRTANDPTRTRPMSIVNHNKCSKSDWKGCAGLKNSFSRLDIRSLIS